MVPKSPFYSLEFISGGIRQNTYLPELLQRLNKITLVKQHQA